MNIIIDVAYLISGFSINIHAFLCKKCGTTSLTIVFTEEDSVVIKFLRQNKGYSARRLVKEFPLKIGKLSV